jgi:hypothetical protein
MKLENVKKDHSSFCWGRVVDIHEIGRYGIVEFRYVNNNEPYGSSAFHVFVDGEGLSHTFPSIEWALAFGIAYVKDGINTRAADYFMKMID